MSYKKIICIATVWLAFNTLSLAASSNSTNNVTVSGDALTYLKQIAQNTTNILTDVNDLPTYISQMLAYVLNIEKSDDSQSTKDMQGNFANTGNLITQNAQAQLTVLPTLNADLLGATATATNLPNANDLVYSTLLGQPFFNPDPRNKGNPQAKANPSYNYIKNAAGISITHTLPLLSWTGTQPDFLRYYNYYNTVTAVESYNGYILAGALAETQNGNPLNTAQLTLVNQASSSTWIATIATEEIGKVLRQLLMFESQTYVLMTQLLQTQKQLLTAQVMTNAMLIAANQSNEGIMLAKAQGQPPT